MKSGVATQQASDGTIIEGEERKKGAAATATAAAAVPTSHFGMNQKRAPASVTRFPPGEAVDKASSFQKAAAILYRYRCWVKDGGGGGG